MTIDQLVEICGTERLAPGQSAVVDPIGLVLLQNNINIAVLDGRKSI